VSVAVLLYQRTHLSAPEDKTKFGLDEVRIELISAGTFDIPLLLESANLDRSLRGNLSKDRDVRDARCGD